MTQRPQTPELQDCLHWNDADFTVFKKMSQTNREDELAVRHENLEHLANALEAAGIPFWLLGKTLLGIFRDGQFIVPDHDDDIGVHAQDHERICSQVYPVLKQQGFQAIRHDDVLLSVIRQDRYIDICFCTEEKDTFGYADKRFPKEFFKQFAQIGFHDRSYPIPQRTEELLALMYPNTKPNQGKTLLDRIYRPIKKIKRKLKKTRKWIKESLLRKDVIRQISREEFIALKLEADNAINWTLRAPHLNVITDNGRVTKIADIIALLKDPDTLRSIKEEAIIETDMNEVFAEPVNLNHKLWKSGNNFLFYCIYYGFRRGVVAYDQINAYIATVNAPMLYSAAYFESLEKMDDAEIRTFLKDHPLILGKSAIVHGKHRACAMIGRLIRGEAYIPFYVKEKVRRF